jgi:rhodanese-related sulfurtransferase
MAARIAPCSCREFYNFVFQDVLIIDVRQPALFAENRVRGAQNFTARNPPPEFEHAEQSKIIAIYGEESHVPIELLHEIAAFVSDQMRLSLCDLSLYVLQGGFEAFEARYPFVCESHPDFSYSTFYPHEFEDGMFIGACLHAHNPTVIRHLGITHVVNAADDVPNIFSGPMGSSIPWMIHYTSLMWIDSSSFPITSGLPVAAAAIESCRLQGGKVLVHCFQGVSRSAAAAAAWLVAYSGRSVIDAHAYLRTVRPIVRINPGFLHQLESFAGSAAATSAVAAAAASSPRGLRSRAER